MGSSRLQLIAKKFVKPATSTPPSLRTYELSLKDQLMENFYMPIALFYPKSQHKEPPNTTSHVTSRIVDSLSKTLASYYPLAGRIVNNNYAECNDSEIPFYEARIRCRMDEILEAGDVSAQDILYPDGLQWKYQVTTPVVAQLNHFDCGGKAVTVCLTHKLCDLYSLFKFAKDWATVARDPSSKPSTLFTGASVLPPKEDAPPLEGFEDVEQLPNCITKKFVFDPEKLTKLKAKAAAESGLQKPSGVEVVSALLQKCAINASTASSGSFRKTWLSLAVNLRPLLGVPNSENLIGNFASDITVLTNDEAVKFSDLVKEIRREKIQMNEKYKGLNSKGVVSNVTAESEHFAALLSQSEMEGYVSSSICKFPTHEIDFGWGRPTRLDFAACPWKNFFLLMDNDNKDGIQVLVALEEKVMSAFQNDPELLEFASL